MSRDQSRSRKELIAVCMIARANGYIPPTTKCNGSQEVLLGIVAAARARGFADVAPGPVAPPVTAKPRGTRKPASPAPSSSRVIVPEAESHQYIELRDILLAKDVRLPLVNRVDYVQLLEDSRPLLALGDEGWEDEDHERIVAEGANYVVTSSVSEELRLAAIKVASNHGLYGSLVLEATSKRYQWPSALAAVLLLNSVTSQVDAGFSPEAINDWSKGDDNSLEIRTDAFELAMSSSLVDEARILLAWGVDLDVDRLDALTLAVMYTDDIDALSVLREFYDSTAIAEDPTFGAYYRDVATTELEKVMGGHITAAVVPVVHRLLHAGADVNSEEVVDHPTGIRMPQWLAGLDDGTLKDLDDEPLDGVLLALGAILRLITSRQYGASQGTLTAVHNLLEKRALEARVKFGVAREVALLSLVS